MEYNKNLLKDILTLWKNNRLNWHESYEWQIRYFKNIRDNIPKINSYFKSLSQKKKDLLKDVYPVSYHLWKAYKDNKIDFKDCLELNKQFNLRRQSKADYYTIQKELLLSKNVDEKYIEDLNKEYNQFKTGKIDWFFDQNKECYSKLLNDDSVKDIVHAMYEVFRNTNAETGSRGAAKRAINQKNSLLSLFELFDLYDSFDLKKIDEICSRIHQVNKIVKESFGFYNLLKKDAFIYNSRVNDVFSKLFPEFDKYNDEISKILPFYSFVKEAFISFFKDQIEVEDIDKILKENNVLLNEDERTIFNINLQSDQMIYLYTEKGGPPSSSSPIKESYSFLSKNLIMYGPPGTGKTFKTREASVNRIVE